MSVLHIFTHTQSDKGAHTNTCRPPAVHPVLPSGPGPDTRGLDQTLPCDTGCTPRSTLCQPYPLRWLLVSTRAGLARSAQPRATQPTCVNESVSTPMVIYWRNSRRERCVCPASRIPCPPTRRLQHTRTYLHHPGHVEATLMPLALKASSCASSFTALFSMALATE